MPGKPIVDRHRDQRRTGIAGGMRHVRRADPRHHDVWLDQRMRVAAKEDR
jgi:hypothetical protein